MKTAALIVFLVVLTFRLSFAQTPAQQEVMQFERDACKAFLDADASELERVLTPDFTLTLSSGEVSTRADEINEFSEESLVNIGAGVGLRQNAA